MLLNTVLFMSLNFHFYQLKQRNKMFYFSELSNIVVIKMKLKKNKAEIELHNGKIKMQGFHLFVGFII